MLWFIRLLENTFIYQLWESTDCSGAVQAASLASEMSKGVGGEKKEKKRTWQQEESGSAKSWWSVMLLPLFSRWALAALLPTAFLVLCTQAPAIWFLQPYFWSCFSMNVYLFFSRQQICSACGCSVHAVLEAPELGTAPWGIQKKRLWGLEWPLAWAKQDYPQVPIKDKKKRQWEMNAKWNHICKMVCIIVPDTL